MKRVITGTIVVLLLMATVFVAMPFLVSSQTVRNGITAKLEELTGRQVTFQGNPSLSFHPFLGFEISDLTIIDPAKTENEKAILNVEKVKAQINLLPALTGKVEITEYQFLRPKIFLKTYGDGNDNWNFKNGSLADSIKIALDNRNNDKSDSLPDFQIGDLQIMDGILIHENDITGTSETISGINGKISWPAFDSELNISGNGIWRGEGITTNASIATPIEILSGGESALSIDLYSQPISFQFDGMANMLANLFVKGELNAQTPSINRLAEVLEIDLGDFSSSDAWSAQGIFEATANNTNLSEASFTIGANTATGVIRVSTNEETNRKLDGTLAFETIDLVNYFNSLGITSETKIQPKIIRDLNIDLRVSSKSINIGAITLDNVAAALIMDNQGWTFDIGDASAFNGKLIAKIGERISETKRQAFLDVATTDMDAESISTLLGAELINISGKTSFIANIRTNKLREGLLNNGLNGSFTGTFKDGEITGIDLTKLVSQTDQAKPEELVGFNNAAATSYRKINLKFILNNGIANLSKTNIQTDDTTVQAIGELDFINGELDLQLQEVTEDGPKPARYLIQGSNHDPTITQKNISEPVNQN